MTEGAAAYKQRIADGGNLRAGPSKAASIQTKVKSLLDESGRGSPSPTKTASGYGKYTDQQTLPPSQQNQSNSGDVPARTSSRQQTTSSPYALRNAPRPQSPLKPTIQSSTFSPPSLLKTSTAPAAAESPGRQDGGGGASLTIRPAPSRPSNNPPKPQPKPQTLRTGDRPPQFPAKPASLSLRQSISSHRQPKQQQIQQQSSLEQSPQPSNLDGAGAAAAVQADEDWETTFSKRYPDLSGLEMVETDIDQQRDISNGSGGPSLKKTNSLNANREMRVRDV